MTSNLSEAILAAGLVKNVGDQITYSVVPKKAEISQPKIIKKQAKKKVQSSFVENTSKSKPIDKGPSIEEIILQRQTNPPLPKLKSEWKMRSRSSMSDSPMFLLPELPSDNQFYYGITPTFIEPSIQEISSAMGDTASEDISFPETQFVARTLGKTQIASKANYEQLLNMLHQMTADVSSDVSMTRLEKITEQKEAYDAIMQEIVKQGYFECSPKGEILQAVRNYMMDSVEQLPIVYGKMQRQKEKMDQEISRLSEKYDEVTRENARLESDNNVLTKAKERLKEQIDFLSERLPNIEEEARQTRRQFRDLNTTISEQKIKINALEDEIEKAKQRNLEREEIVNNASKNLTDLTDRIRQLNEELSQTKSQNTYLTDDFESEKRAKAALEAKLSELQNQLSEATKPVEKIPTKDMPVQVNLISKLKSRPGMGQSVVRRPTGPLFPAEAKLEEPEEPIGSSHSSAANSQTKASKVEQKVTFVDNRKKDVIEANGKQFVALVNTSQKNKDCPEYIGDTVSDPSAAQNEPKGNKLITIGSSSNFGSSVFGRRGPSGPTTPSNKQRAQSFDEMKRDYQEAAEIIGDSCTISIDTWSQLREMILAKNNQFNLSTQTFIDSQNGDIPIINGHPDSYRIFAHAIMTRIMDRVTAHVPAKYEIGVQHVPLKNNIALKNVETFVEPVFIQAVKGHKDAFTKLLDPKYSDRQPRTFEWTLKSIRSIFDEKTLRDATDFQEGRPISTMPTFALTWATRQYGLSFLAQQCAWDLVNSSRAHQGKCLEIAIFRQFLDMDLTTDQLTFFLRVRQSLLRKCISVVITSDDGEENFASCFLTSFQAVDAIKGVFEKAGQVVIDSALREIRPLFVRKPGQGTDEKFSYIEMIKILEICIDSFSNYESQELRKLARMIRITPAIDSNEFEEKMHELSSGLTKSDLGEIYRIIMSSNSDKLEYTFEEFKSSFKRKSLLTKDVSGEGLIIDPSKLRNSEFEKSVARWLQIEPLLNKALTEAESREQNPSISQCVVHLKMEMTSIESAITCFDTFGINQHIMGAFFALQNLQWTISEPPTTKVERVLNTLSNLFGL